MARRPRDRRPVLAHRLVPSYADRNPDLRYRNAIRLYRLREMKEAHDLVERALVRLDAAREAAPYAATLLRQQNRKLRQRYRAHRRREEEFAESMSTYGGVWTWRVGGPGRRLRRSRGLLLRLEHLARKAVMAHNEAESEVQAAEELFEVANSSFHAMKREADIRGSVRVSNVSEALFALSNGWEPLVCKFVDINTTLEIIESALNEFGVLIEALSNKWRDRNPWIIE